MQFDLKRALAAQIEGKAITPHPALQGSDPISIYSPGASRQDAVLSQREAGRHLEAYGGDQAIDWVMDAIGLYADPASTAPFRLEKDDGTKLVEKKTPGTPPDVEQGPQELYDLLKRPNPYVLYDELISLLIIDLLLVGNAYWLKWRTTADGKPLALYRMAPGYVKIVPSAFGPKGYEYQPPGAKEKLKIDDPTQVIHFRRPNPHSAYYGLGIIQGGGRSFDLELAITDTMAHYYENKADPSLIVESERRIPRDVKNKLHNQLRARSAGPNRAGELMLLEAGLKANTLSPNARDALFDDLSRMSRNRVFSKFHVFPDLLGIIDEQAGADKVGDHRREFDNSSLIPFFKRLQTKITESLVAAWGCEYFIDYRYQMSVEDIVKTGSDFAAVPGIKVREVRRYFAPLGIEESTGDEDIDETVLNLPGENMDATGQGVDGGPGLADRGAASEAGRPPKGENTAAFPKGAAVRQPSQKALSYRERLARIEAKALVQEGNVSVGNRLKGEQRPPDSLERARTDDINSIQKEIERGLDNATHTLERGLLDHLEGKAVRVDIVKRVKNSKSWTTFTNMITSTLEDAATRAVSTSIIHQGEAGHSTDEEFDYEEIAKSVVHRPSGVRSIVNTLKDRIVNSLKEAKDTNGDLPSLRQSVTGTLRTWKEGQAEAIADTEATHAYNEGTLTLAETLGMEDVFVTDGQDHDEPCKEADGQTWTIEHARENRLEHPRCRRAFILSPSTT